ncbi:phage baseplate assembly protein V [Pseudomonas sp. o96-267]|uniref:phage baseplate assembly protein V n=1 Tax=Pseudomonas sp. o96-267 TaxID=2479853 RepID=UPI000F78C6F6|nr:phage baseplate assembly protein V [Pseudomonas sp. o96-267]RRV28592.1 phage baseplate assembly protein V [Pseudomonas sp. o96-267]
MPVELEYGEVSAVDYQGCRIRVRLDERDGVQSYWLNVPQRHTQGTKSRPLLPEMGEQVAVLLDADGVGGVYLGGVYSTAEPPPVVDQNTNYVRFSDGTVVTYDRAAHVLAVDCVGATTLKCGQGLSVETGAAVVVKAPEVILDASQTTLLGNLQVNGNVNASGTIMDAGGNSNHHTH